MPERLVKREIECVLLAARMSDKDVASNLGIAPRTVANHLHSAYQKLGVHDRKRAYQALVKVYPGMDLGSAHPPISVLLAGVDATEETAAVGDQIDRIEGGLPQVPGNRIMRLSVIAGFALMSLVIAFGGVAIINACLELLQGGAPSGAR